MTHADFRGRTWPDFPQRLDRHRDESGMATTSEHLSELNAGFFQLQKDRICMTRVLLQKSRASSAPRGRNDTAITSRAKKLAGATSLTASTTISRARAPIPHAAPAQASCASAPRRRWPRPTNSPMAMAMPPSDIMLKAGIFLLSLGRRCKLTD
jgi:hypothetical protein